MMEFLGKHMPKEHDSKLSKIQAAIFASIRPLTSAWQHLTDEGLEEDPTMLVPRAEVLSLIQCTICLIGNAAHLPNATGKDTRNSRPILGKFASDDFPSAQDTLFGKKFQSSLTKRVKQDTHPSQNATRREKTPLPLPVVSSDQGQIVFSRGPLASYGGRQGRSFFPYSQNQRANASSHTSYSCHPNSSRDQMLHTYAQKPRMLFYKPKLLSWKTQNTPQKPQ